MEAFLSFGFRPFYLGAAVFAAIAIPLWIGAFLFGFMPETALPPYLWHAHEMLFGFAPAVIAGFLLTAARNWTGLPTASGRGLAALFLLWVAGRLAPFLLSPVLAAVVDLAFLPALAVVLAVPLWRARNTRNYFVVAVLLGLWLADGLFHLAAQGAAVVQGAAAASLSRIATTVAGDVVLVLMTVIGGRVIPAFSANAIPGLAPRTWPLLERAAIGGVVVIVVLDLAGAWLGNGLQEAYRWFAVLLAVLHGVRLAAWKPWRTCGNALLLALPLAYLWIPIHLLLRGWGSSPGLLDPVAAHALFVGAMASLMLAMMTRSARGHTGRPLSAGWPDRLCFLAIHGAALARILGPVLMPARYDTALMAAAVLWALGFATFAITYAPWLLSHRADGKR
ncbi:MAG: NnrS family protein [Pseudomonadales bacterium]